MSHQSSVAKAIAITLTLTASLLASTLSAQATPVATSDEGIYSIPPNKLWRINGKSREETAILASQIKNPKTGKYVVIASGQNFADALSASLTAKLYNAPILLTNSETLHKETQNELNRLRPNYIVIVGGSKAISKTVEQQLRIWGTVFRLYGKSREETSSVIARDSLRIHKEIDTLIITTGNGFADAISASGLSQQKYAPILLATSSLLSKHTLQTIGMIKPKQIVVVGGSKAVPDSIINQVKPLTHVVKVVKGNDRFHTNFLTNVMAYPELYQGTQNPKLLPRVFVTNAANWPDALTIGPLAARYKAPVILTPTQFAPPHIVDSIITFRAKQIIVVGGQKAVSSAVFNQLSELNNAKYFPCFGQDPKPLPTTFPDPSQTATPSSISPTGATSDTPATVPTDQSNQKASGQELQPSAAISTPSAATDKSSQKASGQVIQPSVSHSELAEFAYHHGNKSNGIPDGIILPEGVPSPQPNGLPDLSKRCIVKK